MKTASELIDRFLKMGGLKVSSPNQISGEFIAYIVTNGDNILTIGEGRPERLKGLLRGATVKKHTKSFIVAAAETWTKKANSFYYVSLPSKEAAQRVEELLKLDFGDFYFENQNFQSLADVSRFLWRQIGEKGNIRLDAIMELVTLDGDAFILAWRHQEFGPQLFSVLGGYYNAAETWSRVRRSA